MGVEGFDEMLAQCRLINSLEESQVDQICQNDYYEMKLANEFEYKRLPDQEQSDSKEDAEMVAEKKNLDSKDEEKKEAQSPEPVRRGLTLQQQLKPVSVQGFSTDERVIIEKSVFFPYFKPEYKLLYGTQFHYIALRQIYTIYERLMKAKMVIDQKVDEDISSKTEEMLT